MFNPTMVIYVDLPKDEVHVATAPYRPGREPIGVVRSLKRVYPAKLALTWKPKRRIGE